MSSTRKSPSSTISRTGVPEAVKKVMEPNQLAAALSLAQRATFGFPAFTYPAVPPPREASASVVRPAGLTAEESARVDQLVRAGMEAAAFTRAETAPLTGGKLKGNHYYRVDVAEPISPEVQPYTAECADIIEALGMTFNEGEAFKALWRLAAARQGRGKPGAAPQYDADKVAHYGARVAAQTKRGS